MADYSMANRKIAYTLGRGRAYISDMSSTSGYMGEKYFQEFGPRFFDMSSASGYMGEKYFQEFGPRFLACHVIFGVSCSKCCVSWRVNINRVNNFRVVSCQNSACQHVHAMSWPPCTSTDSDFLGCVPSCYPSSRYILFQRRGIPAMPKEKR